jgi:hypothetical protein
MKIRRPPERLTGEETNSDSGLELKIMPWVRGTGTQKPGLAGWAGVLG